MHNIDRTTNEMGFENEFAHETNEFGFETEQEFGYELSSENEFSNQEYEMHELELANELMEINNEQEFGDWLRNRVRQAAGAASRFIDSPAGQQATQTLTQAARQSLPNLGRNLGDRIGKWGGDKLGGAFGIDPATVQQAGGWLGQKAGQLAANKFPAFVRFATDSLRNLSKEYEMGYQPQVRPAIARAASRHYPVILNVKGTLSLTPGYRRPTGYGRQYELGHEQEFGNETNYEFGHETETSYESPFNAEQESELAGELLAVSNEQELNHFIGKLIKKAVPAVKGFLQSAAGQKLGGFIKGAARKLLPIAGKVVGGAFGGPIGSKIGGFLGNAASNLFELELEGLSNEDREYEIARAYIRFAGSAANSAARHPQWQINPGFAARRAMYAAARRYAPGYFSPAGSFNNDSGTWFRQGNRIIINL